MSRLYHDWFSSPAATIRRRTKRRRRREFYIHRCRFEPLEDRLLLSGEPSVTNGLVSWWPAESNADDEWDGNDGTLVGDTTFAPGKIGQAFSLDGANDRVAGTLNGFAGGDSAVTVAAWFNQSASGGHPGKGVIGIGSIGSQRQFFVRLAARGSNEIWDGGDGQNRLWIGAENGGDDKWWASNAVITAGQWHHAAVTYSPVTRQVSLYVNGAPDRTIPLSSGLALINNFYIGGDAYNDNFFNGLIDEPIVFDRALAADEIRALYNPPAVTAGLVSWWPADGDGGDAWNGNDGSLQNGASYAPGLRGQAFAFDGVDDEVVVPNSANLNFGHLNDQPFTFSAWVKRTSTSQGGTLISKYNTSAGLGRDQYIFRVLDDGAVDISLYDSNGGWGRGVKTAAPTLVDLEWHHVAATYDPALGVAGLDLYVDGQQRSTSIVYDNASYVGMHATPEVFRIGSMIFSTGARGTFAGLIDEPLVYNRALTAAEIHALASSGFSGLIRGQKYHDLDNDGVHDLSEPGLDGWTVELVDQGSGLVVATAVTGSVDLNDDMMIDPETEQGLYSFTGLAAGNYVVREVFEPEWRQTFPQGLSFDPAVMDAGSTPSSVAAGDFDNDDDLDLAISNYLTSEIRVLLNQGSGLFAPAVSYAVTNHPRHVVAADLDGDGDLDLAAPNNDDTTISVLMNLGTGLFAPAINYNTGALFPTILAAADLNGDGHVDLAVPSSTAGIVTVFLNNGSGAFPNVASFGVQVAAYAVTAADLDDDGDFDLAVTDNGGFSVLLNNGAASFAPAVHYSVSVRPNSIAAADFDGDGDIDLSMTNEESDTVSVVLNNGQAVFGPPTNNATGDESFTVAAADIDRDGDIDLAVGNNRSLDVSVLLNDGTGSFAAAINIGAVGARSHWVTVADLNGDGAPDLALNDSVLFNTGGLHEVELSVGEIVVGLDFGNGLFLAPDLVITPISSPPAAGWDETVEVSWTVTNEGTAAAAADWFDAVFLSADDQWDGTDIQLVQESAADETPLAVSASYSVSRNIIIPPTLTGPHYLLFVTDRSNVESETEETNNVESVPIDLTAPDLVVESIDVPAAAQFGQSIDVSWTVRNDGDAAARRSWSDRIWLSNDASLSGDDVLLLVQSASASPLGAGAGYSKTAAVILPLSATVVPGTYHILADTDALAAQPETNEINNLASHTFELTLPPLPDLIVSDIVAPIEAFSGQSIPILWTITNSGDGDAVGTWVDRVYLSTDDTVGGDQLVGSFSFTGAVAAGQSIVRTQSISLPIDASGPRWVVVHTDADNSLFEYASDGNNSTVDDQAIAAQLSPFPNLVVSNVTAPQTAFSSQQTVVQWTVSNTGTGATSSPTWRDGVWLSLDSSFDELDTFLGRAENASYLNAGESYTNSLGVTLPQGIDGNYYFLVKTDEFNDVNELSGESDNFGAGGPTDVELTPPPDLQVTTVDAPLQAFSGQPMSVSWTVANAGPGQTLETAWTDQIYLSADPILDGGDQLLGVRAHAGALNPGASYSATQNVTPPIGLSGDFYFIVRTDAANAVFEHAFEANNDGYDATATTINLTPPPDLEVELVDAPTAALAGHSLVIEYRVTNYGSTVTPNSSWTDSFYLSLDTQLNTATDSFLGNRVHFGALDAGQSYDGAAAFTLPDGLTGSFYVFVVTDNGDAVFELDNTNNTGYDPTPVVVSSQPADLVVTSASAPPTAEAGKSILVSWTVANQGSGDTSVAAWTDRVVASVDSILGNADDVALGSIAHNGSLAIGGSYSISQLVTIPITLSGMHYLFVSTDVGNQVFEAADEANNYSLALPVLITRQTADLQLTQVTAPAAALSGNEVSIEWTVTNDGAGSTNSNYWYDEVYLSADTAIGSGDIALGAFIRSNSLGQGEQYGRIASFTLPLELSGDFYVIVRTDATNLVFEDNLEGNNDVASAMPISVTRNPIADLAPNLAVTNVDAPAQVISGQSFTVSWTVENTGDLTAAGSWYDAVYLSPDQIFDRATDFYLGFKQRPGGLVPGGSYNASEAFSIPRGLAGPFYVFVAADSGDQINERANGELNNVGYDGTSMLVTLAPPADLAVGTITVPTNGVPGQNATISYTVQNQGANDATGAWFDSIYISADDQWDLGDAFFGRVHHQGGVLAGASYTEMLTAPLPGVLPGNYHVIVRSDIRNHIAEADENNNVGGSLNQFSVDAAVLQLGVSADGTLGEDQSAYYRFEVGAGETLRVVFDSESTNAANELYVRYGAMPTRGQFDVASLQPFSADQDVIVPLTQEGSYYILVQATSGGTPGESDAFTLTAQTLNFEVLSVAPTAIGNSGPVTLVVRGSKLHQDTVFEIVTPATSFRAARVFFENSSLAYVTFNLSGVSSGTYDFRASRTGATALLVNAVEVVDGQAGRLEGFITGPSEVRPARTNRMQVSFGNSGQSDITSPIIVVSTTTATPFGQAGGTFQTDALLLMGLSPDGPVNVLGPGQAASYSFDFRSVTNPIEYQLEFIEATDPRRFDLAAFATEFRPIGRTEAEWDEVIARLESTINGRDSTAEVTIGELVQALGETAQRLSFEGRKIIDARQLFAEELANTIGNNGGVLSGQLLDDTTHEPLADQTVLAIHRFAQGETPVPLRMGRTSVGGQFVISNLPAGSYDLSVPGFVVNGQFEIVIVAGEHAENVVLTATDRWIAIEEGGFVANEMATPVNNEHHNADVQHTGAGAAIASEINALVAADLAYRPGSTLPPGWALAASPITGPLGFGASFFYDNDLNLIVAFRGTDGLNPRDWWTNLNNSNPQWNLSRQNVFNVVHNILAGSQRVDRFITVTGHSLGGALAQLFCYDAPPEMRSKFAGLLTFNAPGALSAIKERDQQYVAGRLADLQVKHIATYSDLVVKIGERHLGSGNDGLTLPIVIGDTALVFLEAHSMQNVLHVFQNFGSTGRPFTISEYFNVAKAQALITIFGKQENYDPDDSNLETLGRIIASLSQLKNIDPATLSSLIVTFIDNYRDAGITSNYVNLYNVNWPQIVDRIAPVTNPIGQAALIGAIVADETSAAGSFVQYLAATLFERIHQLEEQIVSGLNKVKAAVADFFNATQENLPQAFQAVLNTFQNAWNDAFQTAASFVLEVENMALQAGFELRQELQNFANGMGGFYDSLVQAARNAAEELLDWLKGFVDNDLFEKMSCLLLGLNCDPPPPSDPPPPQDPPPPPPPPPPPDVGPPVLSLIIAANTILESGGTNAVVARTNFANLSVPLVVTLSSSDIGEAVVPSTVIIPAGAYAAVINLDGVDDQIEDGIQTVAITASATGYPSASDTVDVADEGSDIAVLTLSVPGSMTEGDVSTGSVRRPSTGDLSTALTVNLGSSDGGEAAVPGSVIIEAGQTSVTFTIRAIDDDIRDGTQVVLINASAAGYEPGARIVAVADAAPPNMKPPYRPPVRFAVDPNDILGPLGFGAEKWVPLNQALEYTIRFENLATATATAQQVTITQTLDADLDPRTFRVGDFGWGDFLFELPENRAFYNQRLDLTAELGFFVDVTAGINVATAEAFWTITAIDPATGELPADALAGFLPPNDATGAGEGFVSYTVRPRSSAATGERIDAQARIVFDTEEPIDTPPIFNTIDAGIPTSQVEALPALQSDPTFLVRWSGQDDVSGSAISGYSILVSVNGGAYTPWLANTTLTEAPFVGQVGHGYRFYSVAHDNAGNVEPPPSVPDAITRILNPLPGDYNVDGQVSAADYILWRKTLGSTVNPLADGDINGTVDQPDYSVWTANFGNALGEGGGAGAAEGTAAVADNSRYPEVNAITESIVQSSGDEAFFDVSSPALTQADVRLIDTDESAAMRVARPRSLGGNLLGFLTNSSTLKLNTESRLTPPPRLQGAAALSQAASRDELLTSMIFGRSYERGRRNWHDIESMAYGALFDGNDYLEAINEQVFDELGRDIDVNWMSLARS
ncbi:MAG: CARDB domain-containing protein [Pirellulales bacterium]